MNQHPFAERRAPSERRRTAVRILRSAVAALVVVTANPALADNAPAVPPATPPAAPPSEGKETLVEIGNDGSPGKLNLVKGQFVTARTSVDYARVIIGNPEVASFVPLSQRTFYILGKDNGRTNGAVLGPDDALLATFSIEVGADVADITKALQQSVPQADAKVDTVNGRVRIGGEVQDAVALRKALEVVGQHSGSTPPINNLKVTGSQQVMLEVRLIEASRNAGRELGISWHGRGGGRDIRTGGFRPRGADEADDGIVRFNPNLTSGSTPFGTLIGNVLSGGVSADVLVQALEERGLARRLAEPNLIALSGERASFLAGGEVPIPVSSDDNRVTVTYKEYGVRLNFTPIVLDGGLINLKLEPEVSQVDESVRVSTGAISVPSFITRRASTTIEVRDGQSFAMAGLLQSTHTKTKDQIPVLGDLPIIGALARSSSFQKQETDLVIIVTPHLVKPAKPGQRLRTPLDALKPTSDKEFLLDGKLEKPREEPGPQSASPVAGAVANSRKNVAPPITGPYGHIVEMPRRKRNVADKEPKK